MYLISLKSIEVVTVGYGPAALWGEQTLRHIQYIVSILVEEYD